MDLEAKQQLEAQRIVAEYARRDRELPDDFYALYRPANLYIFQGHERAVLWGLQKARLAPLDGCRVLDVGCGYGEWLGVFERFGARRDMLAGIDLTESRVAVARAAFPDADVRQGDASALPWNDHSFDVVFQRTIVSSILDPAVRQQVAGEMLRVLRPGGAILWLEFSYNNPRNPNVCGIGRKELWRLFPACRITSRRVTLAPPLARRLAPISWTLAQVLEALRVLNTHYLAVIQRRS
jgi:ubiquinone/menaquinone biosynthesis C-methylase UbiE